MKNCPYCFRERGSSIKPHYTKHMTEKGETWIAYCPVCGARTPYFNGGNIKTLEQAKASWNAYWLAGKVRSEDVPMQSFSPD